MVRDLPSGQVTLVFTDIEGSTKLLHELGPEVFSDALAEHRRLLREAYQRHGGVEVDTQGDAFFYAFPDAAEAVAAAEEGGEALRSGRIHVRVGIHTGSPHLGPEGYVGQDVHFGARIGAAGHGGQVLLSQATREAAGLADDALHDLGEHRLKDFDRPIPIFQLGDERFPPLKTISNTNLPRPASSFVGRERETAEVVRLIHEDGARLVTLTGPGGSGKTRLSLEVAAELIGDHKAGTFWVELAPIRDSALVADEIGKTVGARDGLADHVGEREMLLVLDNLEQVIDVGPALADLVEKCPNLAVLATSRERLRVRGEVEYAVSPLAESDAAALFVARAGLSEPDEVVPDLCRALDEMPLAIELAAARASVLTPAQILERLEQRLDLFTGGRDADPRQRTLRSTIEWSHDLLDPEEQRLFARLAVFAGGATLGAVDSVAGADLDTLQSIVDKSLVRRTDDRYWMYETIREFALEQLDASGEADEIERGHAGWYLALAEEAEPHLFSADAGRWHDRLEEELDNIRTALETLEASGDTERALRLAGSLAEFWAVKGHLAEGRRQIERALEADRRPTAARARALNGAADLATGSGDDAAARVRAEEGLALNRRLGDRWGTADSLLLLGINHIRTGRLVEAGSLIEQSVLLFRELGDGRNELEASRFLAWAYSELGDLARARALNEDNLRQARALGDLQIEGRVLSSLASYALDEGRGRDAGLMLKDAYRVNRQLGDDYFAPIIVCHFAHALAIEGKADAAAQVLSSGRAQMEEIGTSEGWIARTNDEARAKALSHIGEAAFNEAWERGRILTADEAVALALEALD
jgi:predicted ATPase/class 3 adenylate cyclase